MTALRFDIWLRERACGGGRPYLAACLVLVCLARFKLVMAARRVTAHDIAQAGDMGGLINHAIDQIRAGNMKTKEDGAQDAYTRIELAKNFMKKVRDFTSRGKGKYLSDF